jgi:hypothetical protein
MKSFKIINFEKEKLLLVSLFENEILNLYLINNQDVYFYSNSMEESINMVSKDIILNSFENENDLFELNFKKDNMVELSIKFILKKGGSYQGASFLLKKKNIPMGEVFFFIHSILMELKKENQELRILAKERNEAVKLSETLLEEREKTESVFISKFLTILNAKKNNQDSINDLLDQSF